MDESIFTTKQLKFNNILNFPDIAIPSNKVTFVVGKNGSGKSTLFKLFNKTLTPTVGEVLYLGNPISDIDAITLRKEVSLISQSVYLFDLTIKDNFDKFYSFIDKEPLSDDEIKKYLRICSLSFPIDSDCKVLSGGERQRVFIAIYLSLIPKVILLDEPTSALDDDNSYKIIKNIVSFCKKKKITPIIISHDNNIVKEFSENTVRLG